MPGRFNDNYKLGKTLGSGAFATVKEGTDKTDNTKYAIKIFEKQNLSTLDTEALHIEIGILKSLNHDHIIKLYNVFDEPKNYYLITELVVGGELFDRIVSKKQYTEKEARDVCKIFFDALDFCHSRCIVHRDLKPENILLLNNDSDTALKIADFGFAKRVPKGGKLVTSCGTPRYVAPEIIAGCGHDTQVDMWSIGVIIYILLSGYAPFGGKPRSVLFERILRGKFNFHEQYWKDISDDAKDLIKKLLTTNPKKRMNAHDALKHSWMSSDELISEMNLDMLKAFQANRKFRAAANAVSAVQKLNAAGSLLQRRRQSLDIPQDFKVEPELDFEPTESFTECFVLGEQLGKGSFGTVKEGLNQKDNKKYAIKIIEKTRLTPEDEEAVLDEVDVLKSLHHPNIIRLYNVFNESDAIFLVTELVSGGELFDRIVKKTNYTEREARDTIKVLLEAVAFCHRKNIAHRDLKPENLLLLNNESDSEVKLADFGFAKQTDPKKPDNCLTTQCGTPEYVAPEIIAGVSYGTKVDMWSLGVISFVLLSGYLPFHGSTTKKMMRRIVKCEYSFHEQYWSETSDGAKDFVRGLLRLDTRSRMSAEDALKHEWIADSDSCALVKNNLETTISNLKKFNAKRKFRSAADAVMALCALQRKLNSLGPLGSGLNIDNDE